MEARKGLVVMMGSRLHLEKRQSHEALKNGRGNDKTMRSKKELLDAKIYFSKIYFY